MNREKNSIQEIKEKIQAADMVLVGIGEEFEDEAFLQQKEGYAEVCQKIAEAGVQWVVPYVNYLFLKDDSRLKEAYKGLSSLLQGKNYFILSYCMDGILSEQELKQDRMAEFCGNWRHFTQGTQPAAQENESVQENAPVTQENVSVQENAPAAQGNVSVQENTPAAQENVPDEAARKALYQDIEACVRGEKSFQDLQAPVDHKTGQAYEFNTLYAEHFEEPEYKENWDRYLKWLQGTLNRKLCILELGAGMRNLNTIRIRYEKIAELNLKSDFIRIHEYLYQIPAGLADRGTGIQKNAVSAMEELGKM